MFVALHCKIVLLEHHLVNRECVNASFRASFNCEQFSGVGNCYFFIYEGLSCYSVQMEKPDVFTMNSTVCFCDTDYCNGDIPCSGPVESILPAAAAAKVSNSTSDAAQPARQSSNEASVLKPCAYKWFALLAALGAIVDHLFKA